MGSSGEAVTYSKMVDYGTYGKDQPDIYSVQTANAPQRGNRCIRGLQGMSAVNAAASDCQLYAVFTPMFTLPSGAA